MKSMNNDKASQTIATLRRYDTPTVCNVIELLGVRPQTEGYADDRLVAAFPDLPPMVGYAATATFRASTSRIAPSAYLKQGELLESFAESKPPPVVVFQDLDSPTRAATFGELMCLAYKQFGAAGLITSGAGRDLDQVQAMDFPVFTSGAICSHGYPQLVDLNVPVNVCGMTVLPGDLIHGDRNGVTTIPLEVADEVAALCEEYVAAERIMIDYLRSTDKPTIAGYNDALGKLIMRLKEMKRRGASTDAAAIAATMAGKAGK